MLCSHSDNWAQCTRTRTLGMLPAQSGCVLICLAGWLDGLGTRPRSGDSIAKSAHTTKTYSIKVLRPPIIDGALQMPVGGRTPSSVPRAPGHPFLATAKMQKKKKGTGVPPVFAFSIKLSKNSGRYRRLQENGKFNFLSIW